MCRRQAEAVAEELREFIDQGADVVGVVGVERSPACSTRQDNPSNYYPSGILMEELRSALEHVGISVPYVSVTGSTTQTQAAKLTSLLDAGRP